MAIATEVIITCTVPPRDQDRDQRQVSRHRQILQHQHGHHRGGLGVVQTPRIRQDFRDHAGRRNISDAAQQHGGERTPAEQKTGDHARREVQRQIHQPGGQSGLQLLFQLVAGVFQTQHEEQQQHSDFGADVNEVLAERKRREPAFSERQAGQQVQRNGGETQTAGEARRHGQSHNDDAQFDKQQRNVAGHAKS